jgi:hypothetical protein
MQMVCTNTRAVSCFCAPNGRVCAHTFLVQLKAAAGRRHTHTLRQQVARQDSRTHACIILQGVFLANDRLCLITPMRHGDNIRTRAGRRHRRHRRRTSSTTPYFVRFLLLFRAQHEINLPKLHLRPLRIRLHFRTHPVTPGCHSRAGVVSKNIDTRKCRDLY